MRSDADIERALSEAPLRRLPAERETELIAALRSATGRRAAWWATPIPLWQAAMGCAAVLAAAVMLLPRSMPIAAETAEPLAPIRVNVDASLFAMSTKPIEPDITRWQPMPATAKEQIHE